MIFFSSAKINRNIRFVLSNILWICIAAYFTYHIFSGARGALSWAILSRQVVALERELANLRDENAFLENKINSLRGRHLDLDLLEEQSQAILGLAQKNEQVVLLPKE